MAKRSSRIVIIAGIAALVAGLACAALARDANRALLYGAGAFIVLFVGVLIGVGVAQGIAEGVREGREEKR